MELMVIFKKPFVMRYILIFLLLFPMTISLFGQESGLKKDSCIVKYDSLINRTIYEYVDLMPEFPGGIDSMKNFVKGNLQWPQDDGANFSGTVFISLIVEPDGNLTNKKIIRGIYGPADNEALKLIDKMPKWIVGKCIGKAVPVRVFVPVKFVL